MSFHTSTILADRKRGKMMDDEKELPDIPWLKRISDEEPDPPDTDYIAMLEELEYK